jgi:hypothetical protein
LRTCRYTCVFAPKIFNVAILDTCEVGDTLETQDSRGAE